jgi:hypothetical protein
MFECFEEAGVNQQLHDEHYEILEILSVAKAMTLEQLGFELRKLGGLGLKESLPRFWSVLLQKKLVQQTRKGLALITRLGRRILRERELPDGGDAIRFQGEIGRQDMIPHSVCVWKKGYSLAAIPNIMIREVRWGERTIVLHPACRLIRRSHHLIIKFGLTVEVRLQRWLIQDTQSASPKG